MDGAQGPAGPQGIPGNLALANQSCSAGSYLYGFGPNGELLCRSLTASSGGCSDIATFTFEVAPDLWICAFNNLTLKTWPQTYGVCNEDGGFHLATVGPMTRRGLPTNAQISAGLTAAAANNHDFITTGHPTRSARWDSMVTSYETTNGLGYIGIGELTGAGGGWQSLTDGNAADLRSWPSANHTGAHRLASLCMNASSDPMSVVFDHRWR